MATAHTRVLSIDVGHKNLALCVLLAGGDPVGRQDAIERWMVIACEPTARGVCDALRNALGDLLGDMRDLPGDLQGDVPGDVREDVSAGPQEPAKPGVLTDVVIERQPPRNATMSRLQHYMEMYFAMQGLPVVVQDAKHKLAFAAGTPWWPSEDLASWTYHTRKKVAVQTVAAFLGEIPQPPNAFAQARKKDDYADCLLQAMAYAHHVRPLELAKRQCAPPAVKPRKPTAAQLASGKLPKSCIAHMLHHGRDHPALHASIRREFGTLDAARKACGLDNLNGTQGGS